MKCPKCNGDCSVGANRHDDDENEIFRVRKCKVCGHKFFTVEFIIEENEKFKKIWKSLLR